MTDGQLNYLLALEKIEKKYAVPEECYLTMDDVDNIIEGGVPIKVMVRKTSGSFTEETINLTREEVRKHTFTNKNGRAVTDNAIWVKFDCYMMD